MTPESALATLPAHIRAQWPYSPRFARVNGWRMHYIDEGAGDPIVLLHGNPTWGFLYRDCIPILTRAGYRVIVPDMIGFGLSEKPTREQAHSLDGHSANLVALITWTWPRWIPLDDSARAAERFEWLEQKLSRCTLPALILWGREDEVFPHQVFATRSPASRKFSRMREPAIKRATSPVH